MYHSTMISKITEITPNTFPVSTDIAPKINPIIENTITMILPYDFPESNAHAITNSITAIIPNITKNIPPTAEDIIPNDELMPVPIMAPPTAAKMAEAIPPIRCKIAKMVTPSGLPKQN